MTTSWDDGHPLDWRITELLAKYDLPGTFYIPRTSQRPTMSEGDVRRLSEHFEIGGHTLHHLALTTLDPDGAERQICGCKSWVEDVTGRQCTAFCPPLGKFNAGHLYAIRGAGFNTARTVELLSLDLPRDAGGLAVLPTSVQAHPHRALAYVKNAVRRRSAPNLARGIRYARAADWVGLCRRLLDVAMREGGAFHLWGHSWEIEETGQWEHLEEALRILNECAPSAARLTNSQLGDVTPVRR